MNASSALYNADKVAVQGDEEVHQALCFHCQLPVVVCAPYQLLIDGKNRSMCCPGCVAATSIIQGAELTRYYEYRSICDVQGDGQIDAHTEQDLREYEAYGKPDFMAQYCRTVEQGVEADLIISGIRCAACVWLLQNFLATKTGVQSIKVNLASHRAYVEFDPEALDIADVFKAINQLGYKAYPYVASIEENIYQQDRRSLLKALGVSALGVMQVMMFTIAVYAGAFTGIAEKYEVLLRWSSLIVATPVVLYSARSFFINAWRDSIKCRVGMDLPVSLAIGGAYVASLLNTVWLSGEVYFESVSMFTFFLLLSRFIELTARQQRSLATNALVSVFPTYALRVQNHEVTPVLLKALKEGDTVQVDNGAVIPADGVILSGATQIDESAFSGESLPLFRQSGDQVFAGSVNVQNPFNMTVLSAPQQSVISSMVRLAERATAHKPTVELLGDKVAGYFVLFVLFMATLAAVYWSFVAPEQVIHITLAVLVVACPCALSLATPVALSVANRQLMQTGLMPTTGRLLTGLAQVDCILFDKTGTLTDGKLTLEKICLVADFNELDILKLAWALEKGVDHPVAKAIVDYAQKQPNVAEGQMLADQQQVTQGCGVCAVIDTRQYYLGNTAFIAEKTAINIPPQPLNSQGAICILLANEQQAIGWIVLRDQLRPDAVKAVSDLQRLAKETHLVSGDSAQASALVANKLAIEHFNGQMKPQDKIAYLQRLTVAGKKVLMVGDGINDAAALKQAHVSIAMHSASEFVQAKADGVMLSSQLAVIVDAIRLASDTRKITRQNITWALIYNVTAMPLAVMGYIPPWFAALGMSVSSLIVLMNSYRLNDVTGSK